MGKFFKSRAPYRRCPRPECGSEFFGILNIHDRHYVRRCNKCDHDQSFDLPDPQKKVIYLDQTAISHMVKAGLGRADAKWTKLEHLLKRAIERQAICCPHSEAHESESLMDVKLREAYKKLYQNLSINTRLLTPHQVDILHISIAFRMFSGGHAKTPWPRWRMIFRQNPNVWTPDMFVSVNLGGREEREARLRKARKDVVAALEGVNDFARKSPKTFEEHFASETKQNALNVVEHYRRNLASMATAKTPEDQAQAFLTGSVYGDTMSYILIQCDRDNPWSAEAAAQAGRFLSSPAFSSMPHVPISSAIYAEISMRTKRGSKGFKASDLTDVDVISHYAPYCDAMFVDNAMSSILTTNPVKDKVSLETRFFSASSFDGFMGFIEDCIRAVPKEIADKALEVYGPPKEVN